MSVTDTLLDITLIPIYTFLILLYRTHFILFLTKLFRKEHHSKLQEILSQIKGSVQSYISGLIIEMIFVSILTSIGLYIIGVPYFCIRYYYGYPKSNSLCRDFDCRNFDHSIIINLSDLSILGVIGVNVVVQIIDNNILVPVIINTKVQINAFVSIIGIIVGGGIAGIAGMFLAIPIYS
jgi:predicted PurR-regulated permease PerM